MPAALLLIGLLISKTDENFQLVGGGVAPPTPPQSGHHWVIFILTKVDQPNGIKY
jgi:hypothetical protein